MHKRTYGAFFAPFFFVNLIAFSGFVESNDSKGPVTSYTRTEIDSKIKDIERANEVSKEAVASRLEQISSAVNSTGAAINSLGQKQVDWWLQLLAILLALFSVMAALASIFIPWFVNRSLREQYEQAIRGARGAMDLATSAAQLASEHAQQAGKSAREIIDMSRAGGRTLEPKDVAGLKRAIADPMLGKEAMRLAEIQLAETYGDFERAVQLARQFVDDFPDSRESFVTLGYCIQKLSQRKSADERRRLLNEAIAMYRREVEREPMSVVAHGNIGWAMNDLAELERDSGKQEKLLEHARDELLGALKINPLYPEALNNLGWTYLLMARCHSANKDRAIELLNMAADKFQATLNVVPNHGLAQANLNLVRSAIASIRG